MADRIIVGIGFIVLFFGLAFSGEKHALVGKKAPALHIGRVLNAKSIPDIDKLRGKVVVLVFLSPGSETSLTVASSIQGICSNYKNTQVLGCCKFAPSDEGGFVKRLNAFGINFPVFVDKDGRTCEAYLSPLSGDTVVFKTSGSVEYACKGYNWEEEKEKVSVLIRRLHDRTPEQLLLRPFELDLTKIVENWPENVVTSNISAAVRFARKGRFSSASKYLSKQFWASLRILAQGAALEKEMNEKAKQAWTEDQLEKLAEKYKDRYKKALTKADIASARCDLSLLLDACIREHAELLMEKANLLFSLKRYSEAYELFERISKEFKKYKGPLVEDLTVGDDAKSLLKKHFGTKEMKKELEADRLFIRARACLDKGEVKRARLLLERVVKNFPGTAAYNKAKKVLAKIE